jgi:CheY-like chemotaxis protein
MDFTRQSESTQRLLDLRELLTKTIDLLSKGLPPEIELELVVGAGEFPVMVDPGQIQQVVANLVLNARDAMPNGGHLTVTLSELGKPDDRGPRPPEVRDGDWLRIAVADTGTGIPPSVRHRVFEPFFTTKRAGTGTGLGLAQVYGNVQQHGGHVDFETTAGVGTTFSIFLRPYRYHRPAETSDRDGAACPRGLGETVLVVEDELAVLNATSQSLRTLGYRVLEAVDGSDALRLFEETERVHLVLSDVRMPGMDGRALAAELKRRDPKIKVLLMTAYATWPEGSEHPPAGVEGVLIKPFSLDSLGAAVHRTLLS